VEGDIVVLGCFCSQMFGFEVNYTYNIGWHLKQSSPETWMPNKVMERRLVMIIMLFSLKIHETALEILIMHCRDVYTQKSNLFFFCNEAT
jgi:hypothetical protein